MKRKGRTITILATAIGTLVLLLSGYAFRNVAIEQYYIWKLESKNETERRIAAERLGGIKSVRAIPRLLRRFRQEATVQPDLHYTAYALVKIGSPAIPVLIEILRDESESSCLKTYAARTLGTIYSWSPPDTYEPITAEAISTLVEVLRTEDTRLRSYVHTALADFGSRGVPFLITTLKDKNVAPLTRATLAKVLGEMVRQGQLSDDLISRIVEALVEALKDPSGSARSSAASALGYTDAKSALIALCEALKDENRDVRYQAAWSLRGFPGAGMAVPSLCELLKENDEGLIRAAANTLQELGPEAKIAVPYLVQVLRRLPRAGRNVPSAVFRALASIGKDAKNAIPVLEELLNDENEVVQLGAATALLRIGVREDAVPVLKKLVNHENEIVRKRASEALNTPE